MAARIVTNFTLPARTRVHINRSSFSTTPPLMIKWRFQKGVEPNPNRYGVLTNLPDYSYVDGRTAPIGTNLYKRLDLNKMYTRQIIDYCNELEEAIESHKRSVEEEKIAQENMMKSRLKEKGETLKSKKQK